MMMIPFFNYHRVKSTTEALQILTTHKGKAKILAGGTDLLLKMESGSESPDHLVSLRDIDSLKYIRKEEDNIILGANTTHREAENSHLIKNELGALHDAVCQVGSVQIRNIATIAGNICNAAPSADTASPLLVLGTTARVLGPKGERVIAMTDFFRGPGKSALELDEILLEMSIPKCPVLSSSAYLKLGRRKAMDLALIGVATFVTCSPDKSHLNEVRIAVTTAAPTPIRLYHVERLFKDMPISEKSLHEAASLASAEASPRSSFRSTEEYRREMIQVLVPRALKKALERIKLVTK